MNKTVGLTRIEDRDILFSFIPDKDLLKLHCGAMDFTLPDGLDTIIGKTLEPEKNVDMLIRVSIPFSNETLCLEGDGNRYVTVCDQNREVEYYIKKYQFESKYSKMKLRFPELNRFLPSGSLRFITDNEVGFLRKRECFYNFSIKFRDSTVFAAFEIFAESGNSGYTSFVQTTSEVTLSFPETTDLDYIKSLYLSVRSFFSFICNRQNIGLRDATISGTRMVKKREGDKVVESPVYTEQFFFYNQKFLEQNEEMKEYEKVPSYKLFSSNISGLFQLFFEQTKGDISIVCVNSIHPSFKYRNLIDLKQSIHITAAFEYYFRTLLPVALSQTTIDFVNDMRTLLDEYINENTGKKRTKAKKFKDSLDERLSLGGKVEKAYTGYDTGNGKWEALAPILSEWFGNDISDLAEVVNDWRNELAHEKREYEPEENVVKAVRLVEHLNYSIILRKAGYSNDEIKAILSEVLIRQP